MFVCLCISCENRRKREYQKESGEKIITSSMTTNFGRKKIHLILRNLYVVFCYLLLFIVLKLQPTMQIINFYVFKITQTKKITKVKQK